MPVWKKICCPIDFSAPSRVALQQAAEIAAGCNAALTLLHVQEVRRVMPTAEPIAAVPRITEEDLQEKQRLIETARKEAEQFAPGRVTTEVIGGAPAEGIVRWVRENEFDLVVMSTHGRTGLKRLLMGSVAEHVIRTAPCSVLVVRPEHLLYASD